MNNENDMSYLQMVHLALEDAGPIVHEFYRAALDAWREFVFSGDSVWYNRSMQIPITPYTQLALVLSCPDHMIGVRPFREWATNIALRVI
jgi:hypothetical protein